jgi:hypothetical protein
MPQPDVQAGRETDDVGAVRRRDPHIQKVDFDQQQNLHFMTGRRTL